LHGACCAILFLKGTSANEVVSKCKGSGRREEKRREKRKKRDSKTEKWFF
tara:strand:+ start:608 stop:757 length:150 start_codon:yes stop_codon:yes gene_type:complete